MHSPRRPRPPRRGFTMIELMMVIIIIAALVAILLPAIGSVRNRAIEGGVKTELSQIEAAISQFKAVYGVEPPSRIVLCEKASDWTGDDTTNVRKNNASRKRSMALIRRIWPEFDFSIDRNINGNGTTGEVLDLTAGECLVFFLGYAKYNNNAASPQYIPQGFSKNPTDPFATGGTRQTPFLEFAVNRFIDTESDSGADLNERMPEYLDSLTGQKTPLLYFSSYEGSGYEGLDWHGTAMDNPTAAEYPNQNTDDDGPYHLPGTTTYLKPQSFQIISPGWDGVFGYGGSYDPQNPETSLPYVQNPTGANPDRSVEWDNITNFSSGRLKP